MQSMWELWKNRNRREYKNTIIHLSTFKRGREIWSVVFWIAHNFQDRSSVHLNDQWTIKIKVVDPQFSCFTSSQKVPLQNTCICHTLSTHRSNLCNYAYLCHHNRYYFPEYFESDVIKCSPLVKKVWCMQCTWSYLQSTMTSSPQNVQRELNKNL